jgi:hypothetical protein
MTFLGYHSPRHEKKEDSVMTILKKRTMMLLKLSFDLDVVSLVARTKMSLRMKISPTGLYETLVNLHHIVVVSVAAAFDANTDRTPMLRVKQLNRPAVIAHCFSCCYCRCYH